MAEKLQTVRGTHDILQSEMRTHRFVVETARTVCSNYGFDSVSTPIFESTEVFKRPLGETSDVVTKEMYTFERKEGESLTLRPEGTAGFVRSFIQHGLYEKTPYKAFYEGAMFRYERPQKGRQRQFHQFGAELLGAPNANADVEVLAMGWDILGKLGLQKDTILHINTLGDTESREAYRTALVEYLKPHFSNLSEDSKTRLEKNPLRILDTKDNGDREILKNAPVFFDYLNEHSATFYHKVCLGLDALNIPYKKDPLLVRGFDYYCHTAFEFITDTLGAQGTVLGGGRYDGLVAQMGGQPTAGIGFAAGIERLCLMVGEMENTQKSVSIIPMGELAEIKATSIAHALRQNGVRVQSTYSGNMKKRMKYADKIGAKMAIILGDNEIEQNIATVRDLSTGEQTEVSLDTDTLTAYIAKHTKGTV